MSTKAIREALDELEEYRRTDIGVVPCASARSELEAIEKAALAVDEELLVDPSQEKKSPRIRSALNLLERIAMDAGKRKTTRTTKRRTT